MRNFDFTPDERKWLLGSLTEQLERFYQNTDQLRLTPDAQPDEIMQYARQYDFESAHSPEEVLKSVVDGLKRYTVHTPHSGYFGLFNPRAGYLSALADYITAIFNPQMAAWSQAPYAIELERAVIEGFGQKFGYRLPALDGTFCSGGAESNLTALLCALNRHYPDFARTGVDRQLGYPRIYCSSEAHHSLVKAARVTGLGGEAVRAVPVLEDLTMDLAQLRVMIAEDRARGDQPFMVVGTAGTTGAGVIDPLHALAGICKDQGLWFHVDAAYGGAIAVSSKYRHLLKGVEQSDSITLDVHKWFSVPMAASLFLTQNRTILQRSFDVRTAYMPSQVDHKQTIDPYVHSIQWSRRLMGLKIYLPLAVYGWEGYEEMIENHIRLGNRLRELLSEAGFLIKNQTTLPVVCFTHPKLSGDRPAVSRAVEKVQKDGQAWVSAYPVGDELTIRACIANYLTKEEDLAGLVLGVEKWL